MADSRNRGLSWVLIGVIGAVALTVDVWFGWIGVSGAIARIDANHGVHGTFRPLSCQVKTLPAHQTGTNTGIRSSPTMHLIGCHGTFTADGGQVIQNVAYSTSERSHLPVQPTVAASLPANVADLRSSSAYAPGGAYALYLVVAGVALLLPIGLALGVRRRWARVRTR